MTLVGAPAPKFEAKAVVDEKIVELEWEDIHRGKWLVLFFYPLDFTFVCPTEIVAFSDALRRFELRDARVAAVSVDSAYTHLAWIRTPRSEGGLGPVSFPLLSDITKDIARKYNVLIKGQGVALRALFIIDPGGIVRHATINDLAVGRSLEEAMRVLLAFQHSAKHGEVCPANWTPGADAIKPDPDMAREYFARVASRALANE